MRGIRRRKIWLAFILVAGVFVAWWLWMRDPLPAEARANFEWFSTLGFPDVKRSLYGRVAGDSYQMGGSEPFTNYNTGFLIESNANTFKVFTSRLWVQTFTNPPPGASGGARGRFEVLDLRSETGLQLTCLRNPLAEEKRPFVVDLSDTPAARRRGLFVLAWACWRQGLNSEASQLYDEATRISDSRQVPEKKLPFGKAARKKLEQLLAAAKRWISRDRPNASKPSMSETLEKDLATLMLWQAAAGFADSSKSRTQILRDIDAYMTHYPKSEQLTHALELAATLRKMIVEDEAHAKIEPTDPAALPLNEKIQELIFHLRDDNASWLLSEWRPLEPGPTNLPSGQLISIGYPAIPQLIAALNSNALTRSVIFYQRFRPSDRYYPGMLRLVGDLAEQLVEEITGRDFSIGVSTPASVTADGTASAFKSAAEAWWAEFQKKGEKQMLIDGVATGARDAPTQAERLFKRYPDAATPAVIRGIRAANDSWIRKQLIEQIAKSSDESVAGFLKEEMKSGPDVECRVAAATGLRQRGGRTEALAVMIREWQNLGEQNGADSDDGETVAKFLGGCDSVEAITALEKGLRQHPVGLRYSVIEFLGETNAVLSEPETTTPSAATLAAIEELLVGALDDKGENFGMRTSFNGESVEDPRICDMAGNSLAERWPDRYRFELFSSLKMRERQRIECLNVWRRAHELPALPLPQPRTTKVAPKDATKVTTIEWAAESAKPDKVFEARIASLKDKPLRGSDLVSVFCDFVRKREPGAVGIEIKAIKDEDLTGVQVIVRLIPTPPVTTGQGWSRIERVSIANKNDLGGGSSGSSSPNSYSTPDEWSDFEEAVNKATSAKPEVPFKIEVRLVSRQ